MSESVVKRVQSPIKYIEKTLTNLKIGAAGYVGIGNEFPSGMNHFLFCMMWNYGSSSGKDALGVNANGQYVYGAGGATITTINLRYYYTD